MAPAMRVVNRRKVGRVKAPAKGRINRRRGSGRMAMGTSLLVGDGWCYPHLTNKGALLVDATGPPRAFQKDRSRANVPATFRRPGRDAEGGTAWTGIIGHARM